MTFSAEIKEHIRGTKDNPFLTYSEGTHTHTILLTTPISYGLLITLNAPFFQEEGSKTECQFIVPLSGSAHKAVRVTAHSLSGSGPSKGPTPATLMDNQTRPIGSLMQYTAENAQRSFHSNRSESLTFIHINARASHWSVFT